MVVPPSNMANPNVKAIIMRDRYFDYTVWALLHDALGSLVDHESSGGKVCLLVSHHCWLNRLTSDPDFYQARIVASVRLSDLSRLNQLTYDLNIWCVG